MKLQKEIMDTKPVNQKVKKPYLTQKQKKLGTILVAVLIITSLLTVSYLLGYSKGFSKGEEKGKKQSTTTASDILNSASNPFRSLTGKVRGVKNDAIMIDTTRGEIKTIMLTDETRVTKKTEILKVSDLKKDQRITIFTSGKKGNLTASRIVVRD